MLNKDKALLATFHKLYPKPKSELKFNNKYQLITCVILSAQCTDKKVNEVTPQLFKTFPSFKELAKAKIIKLEKIIRPINYYKTKTRNLIKMAKQVVIDFNNKLPNEFDDLIKLAGVGRKTANVIQNELGIANTLPVDTHVFRVSQRLGLAKGKKPREIEEQLKKKFASSTWRNLHHYLILHGRRVCKAQNPKCGECAIRKYCSWYMQ